jgi:hypothetical protein
MPRKPKFKPVITRIKLNPEQAVLVCDCWNCNAHQGQSNTYLIGVFTQGCDDSFGRNVYSSHKWDAVQWHSTAAYASVPGSGSSS